MSMWAQKSRSPTWASPPDLTLEGWVSARLSQPENLMPKVILHKGGEVFEGDVAANTNLVVSAGIRKFPFPNLAYKCGMGKCSTCTCRILAGADHLEPPNWKEKRQLGERLDEGYRLACQLWVTEDIELAQDV